jgi:hypothetical protein
MNSFWVGVLFKIVQRLVGGDFFEITKALVLAAASTEYKDTKELSANEQRKLAVKAQLKELQDDLGAKAKSMGGWLLSLVVDAAVGKLKDTGLIK